MVKVREVSHTADRPRLFYESVTAWSIFVPTITWCVLVGGWRRKGCQMLRRLTVLIQMVIRVCQKFSTDNCCHPESSTKYTAHQHVLGILPLHSGTDNWKFFLPASGHRNDNPMWNVICFCLCNDRFFTNVILYIIRYSQAVVCFTPFSGQFWKQCT